MDHRRGNGFHEWRLVGELAIAASIEGLAGSVQIDTGKLIFPVEMNHYASVLRTGIGTSAALLPNPIDNSVLAFDVGEAGIPYVRMVQRGRYRQIALWVDDVLPRDGMHVAVEFLDTLGYRCLQEIEHPVGGAKP
jgi:hypothetical protein